MFGLLPTTTILCRFIYNLPAFRVKLRVIPQRFLLFFQAKVYVHIYFIFSKLFVSGGVYRVTHAQLPLKYLGENQR